MSKSFDAKVVSDLLELFDMYTEKNSERMIAGAVRADMDGAGSSRSDL